jgi:hypothetical protein
LKFLNQANELHVSESFSFFGFKNKQIPANLKRVQAFNSVSNQNNFCKHANPRILRDFSPSYLRFEMTALMGLSVISSLCQLQKNGYKSEMTALMKVSAISDYDW